MKTLKLYASYLAFVVFVISTSSCTKFLDERVFTDYDAENLLKTEEGVNSMLIGIYQRLSTADLTDGSFRKGLLVAANFGTDDFSGRVEDNAYYFEFNNYLLTSTTSILKESWENFYRAISQSSAIINSLPSNEDLDEDVKKHFIAEAKFMRGFYYFYLVRFFGGVPLVTTSTVALEEAKRPRASIEEIYTQIIKDFEESVDDLPTEVAGLEIGRATKGAALGFLSKVYLTLASHAKYQSVSGFDWVDIDEAFEKSSAYGQQVLEMPQYSLISDYASIFDGSNENSSEIIFAAQMYGKAGINGNGSFAGNYFAPGNAGNILVSRGGQGHALPTLNLVERYESGDLRKGVNIAYFKYNGCEKEPFTQFAYAGKFPTPCGFDGVAHSTPNNIPLLRLADVMLMIAEAEAELNNGVPNTLALKMMDDLRMERFGNNVPPPAPNTDFLDFLFDERSRELCYEAQRWFDLVRTKRLVDAVKEIRINRGTTSAPKNISDRNYLYPIPQAEILTNEMIGPQNQNPGYH